MTTTTQPVSERKALASTTLTSVQLGPQTIGQIVTNLGVAYDLMKIIDCQQLETHAQRFQLHVDLVKALQAAGFPAIGLPGQEFITEKNKPKWSKASLTKLLSGNASLPATLHTLLLTHKVDAKLPARLAQAPDKASVSKLIAALMDRLLGKKDFIECEGAARELETRRSTSKWRLDAWQHAMTSCITQGKSVLVNGPTGAGKTFCSMIAIDWLLTKKSHCKLAYIAPTFHLALQTYANIKLTFPQAVSLITSVANMVVSDAQVWVGTPLELWAYLQATRTTFSIGIFDEIHMVGATYSADKMHRLRAEAMSNLLGLCQEQVIALSATIHADDLPVLQKYIADRTGIASVETVVYTERPVPSTSWVWTGTDLTRLANEAPESMGESISAKSASSSKAASKTVRSEAAETKACKTDVIRDIPISSVTPDATFALLRSLSERDMLPGLVFDGTEQACYEAFVAYIEWIEKEEAHHYATWHRLHATLGPDIEAYNDAVASHYAQYSVAHGLNKSLPASGSSGRDDKEKHTKTSALKELLPRVRQYAKERAVVAQRVMAALSVEIARLLQAPAATHKYTVPVTPELTKALKKVFESHPNIPRPTCVSAECRDLIREWQMFAELLVTDTMPTDGSTPPSPDVMRPLPLVAESVGPLFRIGVRVPEIDTIRHMLVPGANQAYWKLRNSMRSLCQAERLRTQDVTPLFKLIARGLEYGVAIVLPSIPFVVQYEMLRLLARRSIKVIFTSQSMSMGVNYPVRSAVIRVPQAASLDVMMFMQMSGRAGRRRLDERAHVVAWNVTNAATANLSTLPRLVLPEHGAERGVLIPDSRQAVAQIDQARWALPVRDALVVALSLLPAGEHADNQAESKNQTTTTAKAQNKAQVKKRRQANILGKSQPRGSLLAAKGETTKNNNKKDPQLVTTLRAQLDATAVTAAVTACIAPLAPVLGLSAADVAGIAQRVPCVISGNIEAIRRDNTYAWAEKMNACKSALAELHTQCHHQHHHASESAAWLQYIADAYEVLHRVSYRLLRL